MGMDESGSGHLRWRMSSAKASSSTNLLLALQQEGLTEDVFERQSFLPGRNFLQAAVDLSHEVGVAENVERFPEPLIFGAIGKACFHFDVGRILAMTRIMDFPGGAR
jgi:hypothetical protein